MSELVERFVNREKQYAGFQKMVARQTAKSVMLIRADHDMGKTWLLQRIRNHCRQHGIVNVHVDFSDRYPYDYLALVRRARDQIGGLAFNLLTATINNLTGVNITLNSGSGGAGFNLDVDGGTANLAGEFAGRDIIKDNTFHIDTNNEIARRAIEIKINDAFFTCMTAIQTDKPIVLLFDTYEAMTEEARLWLNNHLLQRMSSGSLPNVIVIIAGREIPEVSQSLKPLVARTGLDLFDEKYVREYLVERRNIVVDDVALIARASAGRPGLLAMMADNLTMDEEDDDDWL